MNQIEIENIIRGKVKLCPFPFARLEIGRLNTFPPCCGIWLEPEFYSVPVGSGEYWNSERMQKLREKILRGDYSFCKREICKEPLLTLEELHSENYVHYEATIPRINLDAIKAGKKIMPALGSLAISCDPRCNLSCPTCHAKVYKQNTKKWQSKIRLVEKIIEEQKENLINMKLSGYGEVFYSPFLRGVLKNISNKTYPQFKSVFILTNGLLFDSQTYDRLRPGSEFIKAVSVSIDAGNEETYAHTRGGDWKRLMKNLKWMSEMRNKNIFSHFDISFVVRKDNYLSMPEFVKLGNDLGVDRIDFNPLQPWPGMPIETEFVKQSVQMQSHQDYLAFNNIFDEVKKMSKVYNRLS